jgi:hypothetical protein
MGRLRGFMGLESQTRYSNQSISSLNGLVQIIPALERVQ